MDCFKGAGLGGRGGGGRHFTPSGIRPLTNQKIPSLVSFYDIHLKPTKPKVFKKMPLAPIYTSFERLLIDTCQR